MSKYKNKLTGTIYEWVELDHRTGLAWVRTKKTKAPYLARMENLVRLAERIK